MTEPFFRRGQEIFVFAVFDLLEQGLLTAFRYTSGRFRPAYRRHPLLLSFGVANEAGKDLHVIDD